MKPQYRKRTPPVETRATPIRRLSPTESRSTESKAINVPTLDVAAAPGQLNSSQAVPDSGDTEDGFSQAPMDVSDDLVRRTVRRFTERYGSGVFGETPARLHRLYERWNRQFFGAELPLDPLFVIGQTRALGWYSHSSTIGGEHEIGFSEVLFREGNKHLLISDETANGHEKFIDDILIHEMVHMYSRLVLKEPERSFHGHGSVYAEGCNRIGAEFGLPAVRSCRDKEEGSPAWTLQRSRSTETIPDSRESASGQMTRGASFSPSGRNRRGGKRSKKILKQ